MAQKDYDDQKVRKNGLTEREAETLPVWAQERLAKFRHDTEQAVRSYEAQFDAQDKTRVAYGDVGTSPRFLPDGPFDRHHFQLDDEHEVTDQDGQFFQVALKEDPASGQRYLMVNSSHPIAAVPQARNALRLHLIADGALPSDPGDSESE